MSTFSQFFNSTGGSGSGASSNIYGNISPPKFASPGNLQNINNLDGVTDSFLVPSNRNNLIAMNVTPSNNGDLVVGNWKNAPVWDQRTALYGTSATFGDFVYNPVTEKYYLSIEGADVSTNNGIHEINVDTGALTKISSTIPEFMTAAGNSGQYLNYPGRKASVAYVDSDGNYVWRKGDVYKKFNTSFTAIQTRTLDPQYTNAAEWYYTEDMTTRVRPVLQYNGAVTASGTNIKSNDWLLVIERAKQRRLIQVSSIDIFNARYRSDYSPAFTTAITQPSAAMETWTKSICPMAPITNLGMFFGNAIRLGGNTRNESVSISDAFLVDRVDYDRWIKDIADAAGLRVPVEAFYGGWVNV